MYRFLTEVLRIAHQYLGPNQKKIMQILKEHDELSTIEIATLVFGRPVKYKTKEYYSTHRSLEKLRKRNLVVSTPRRKMWSIP